MNLFQIHVRIISEYSTQTAVILQKYGLSSISQRRVQVTLQPSLRARIRHSKQFCSTSRNLPIPKTFDSYLHILPSRKTASSFPTSPSTSNINISDHTLGVTCVQNTDHIHPKFVILFSLTFLTPTAFVVSSPFQL